LNKAILHGFEQSSSAMATQRLEGKVQQYDEDAESSKTGCRSPSRAHGKAYEQVPALICGSYARRSFARSCHLEGLFAPYEQNPPPPEYLGEKSEVAQ